MLRIVCKSKIHRAIITEANLNYTGSITIDEALLNEADILPYEWVQVLNINNGSRIETYAIPGEFGSGQICLNGPAARWGLTGDLVIIISYALMSDDELQNFLPKMVFVDKNNHLIKNEG